MGLCNSRFAPPYYPADVVRGFYKCRPSGEGILGTLIQMKIEDYRARHCGKSPAKIFITIGMFLDISEQIHCDVMTSAQPESKLFGIPVSLIDGKGSQIYLSDEEGEA